MSEQPWLVIIGGPNGAGKTTFAKAAAPRWSLHYMAPDLVAEELGLGTAGPDAFRAGRLFTGRIRVALSHGESLLVESTLSGLATRRLIRRARASGYRVSVGFVYVNSVEACIWRIRARVQSGGHPVSDDDVRRRFRRSLVNFWDIYRFEADAWHLAYNGGEDVLRVAFGQAARAVVVDPRAFERFLGLLEA
jgi:predicted ABC-type ATPase